jgi:hypothetical protein
MVGRLLGPFFLISCLFLLSGCNAVRLSRDCEKLAGVLSTVRAPLPPASAQAEQHAVARQQQPLDEPNAAAQANELRGRAKMFEGVAKQLKATHLQSPELTPAKLALTDQLNTVAQQLVEAATAVSRREDPDRQALPKAVRDYQKAKSEIGRTNLQIDESMRVLGEMCN